MKKMRIGPVLLMAAMALPCATAQAAGEPRRHLVQAGWFHIDTLEESQPLTTELRPGIGALLGVQERFTSAGTGATVSSSDTLALIYSYFVTDDLSIKFEGGIPAKFELSGYGTVAPTGPVGQIINVDLGAPENNPLAEAVQWSPALVAQYFFRDAREPIRPYVGLGVTYTWFTDEELNPQFEAALNERFGRTLALATGNTGPTSVKVKAASDVAPIFNMGVSADLGERWNLSGSISYTLLETTSTIEIFAQNGTRLVKSTTDVELNPLVIALLLGYRFDL